MHVTHLLLTKGYKICWYLFSREYQTLLKNMHWKNSPNPGSAMGWLKMGGDRLTLKKERMCFGAK